MDRTGTLSRRTLAGVLLLLASAPASAQSLAVQRITPAGEDVPPGQQLVIHFDRPMVALGSTVAGHVAVRVRPRLSCDWRWLTPSALACQLDAEHALAPSTLYTVVVEAGWRALDGARLQREHLHQFVTHRPRVDWVGFETWLSPGMPVMRVTFTQAVTRESVAGHLFVTAGGSRVAVTAAAADQAGLALLADAASEGQRARAALLGSAPATLWLVRPVSPLPLDREATLRVEPGLDAGGPQPGVEQREVLAFHTFPPFEFLGFSCTSVVSGDRIEIDTGAVPVPRRCDPLAGIALDFSAPVSAAAVGRGLALSPDLAGGRTDFDPWENAGSGVHLGRAHEAGRRYRVWLPAALQAYRDYRLRFTPALRDAFDRPLRRPVDEPLLTAHRRPRLALTHPLAVLEAGVDSELPIYVTNLTSVQARFRSQDTAGTSEARTRTLAVPEVEDLAVALPLGVREMLAGDSGVVSGLLHGVPADRDGPSHFFAQVTPFAATVKLGHFDSLVWVTDLATGEPVAGARVTVYTGIARELPEARDTLLASAVTDAAGIAALPGLQVLDPTLSLLENWREDTPRLLLRVERDAGLALLPLSEGFRVWTRQVWPQPRARLGHLRAWGTTAQGIYRLGESVDYKLYVRHQDGDGLVAAPALDYRLRVIDPKGQPLGKERSIELSRFGSHAARLRIPETGAVGWYRFQLRGGESAEFVDAFRVLVSDFTPAPFQVSTRADRTRVGPLEALRVSTQATLHAGGAFTGGEARIVARLEARPYDSPHPRARGFHFSPGDPDTAAIALGDESAALDADGRWQREIRIADGPILNGVVLLEGSVRDERGKSVAGRAQVSYRARDRMVGLRATGWLYQQGEASEVQVLVVDDEGAPAQGVPVEVRVERLETFTARVKGAGNAYLERHESRWVDDGGCALRSSLAPVSCAFVASAAGPHRFVARILDSRQREHRSTLRTYVAGSGHVQWPGAEDGAVEIVPDKPSYAVGERARFLVKNPYPGARALITVERYGVLRSFQRTLQGSTPVIELPIEARDAPGFYLGLTLLSPRAAAPPPEPGQVDLGKPALRVGYLEVPVSGEPARLTLRVSSAKASYKPRQRVELSFELPPQAGYDGSPVELAVAVLDEAVLELLEGGPARFDPHRGFRRLEQLDVVSFSLLSRLIGRQKFERKGASAGGDGGAQALAVRDLFRYVGYWNPSLELDASGRARAAFELPDNLTGWRVLAMAVTPAAGMGLGETRFTVNAPTELRPIMPNQLSAGDRAKAGFSLLNRSDGERTLQVELAAAGTALAGEISEQRSVTLGPFQGTRLWLDVASVRPGRIVFTARAGDGLDRDALRHELPVRPRSVREQLASYGVLEAEPVEVPIGVTVPVLAGSAALQVDLSPSVLGNLDGAFRYMRDYPYACWEQRLSRATMARHFTGLAAYLDPALDWPGAAALPRATLADAARFQAPNGGMCYWDARDERVSPYLSAYTALAFGWLARQGVEVPEEVESRLHGYLQVMLRKDVAPGEYDRGMAATVRAVALAALAGRGALDAADLERYAPHLPRMDLFGKAHFLLAVLEVEGDTALARSTLELLLGHAEHTAGRVSFNEVAGAGGGTLHSSARRTECAALGALLRAGELSGTGPALRQLSADLARGVVTGRGSRGHFENTQENLFCVQALSHFARRFESTPVAAEVQVLLQGRPLGGGRIEGLRAPPLRILGEPPVGDGGATATLRMERSGSGRIYYETRLGFEPAQPPAQRVNAGLAVRRELSVRRDGRWRLLASPAAIHRGEVVRVDLYLSAPGRRHFVVVDDPVPGGLEPVDANLATAAGTALAGGGPGRELDARAHWFQRTDWRRFGDGFDGFYHRELRHHSVHFFADALQAGHYHLHYTAQAIASGEFQMAPVRAEEMYDPEVFGLGLADRLQVSE